MNWLEGEGKEDNIGNDRDGRVGIPIRLAVDASTTDCWVPEKGDGCALGDGGDGGRNHEGQHNAKHHLAGLGEP